MTFFLVISGTETIKHPGISAAGASQDLLKYTAALDAEYLAHGKTKTLTDLPVSPDNIVSPALISKACLDLLGLDIRIVNAGAPVKPDCEQLDLGTVSARSIEIGYAVDLEEVQRLYIQGRLKMQEHLASKNLAKKLSNTRLVSPQETCPNFALTQEDEQKTVDETLHAGSKIVIAECVVGGTTTAMGLVAALGYPYQGLGSSSVPQGAHKLKAKLISQGLQYAQNVFANNKDIFMENFPAEHHDDISSVEELTRLNPLTAISFMGDPMQAFVTGACVEAIEQNHPLTLAGGTQMIAIARLIKSAYSNSNQTRVWEEAAQDLLEIVSTPWILNDASANIPGLLKAIDLEELRISAPQIKSSDFEQPDHKLQALQNKIPHIQEIIQAYEAGHVKEGVGMGALLKQLRNL